MVKKNILWVVDLKLRYGKSELLLKTGKHGRTYAHTHTYANNKLN